MKQRISYTKYIAFNNTEAAQALLDKYGYQEATNSTQLENTLKGIIQQNGESALIDVLELHPDKQMILDVFGSEEKKSGADGEAQHNCACADGSSGCDGKKGCGGCNKKKLSFEGCGSCRNGKGGSGEDLAADGNGVVTKSDLQNAIASLGLTAQPKPNTYEYLFGGAVIVLMAVVLLKSK